MHKIAILLVTYIGDIKYVERLILSYKKYNSDEIPMYIAVPRSDMEAFEKFAWNMTRKLTLILCILGIRRFILCTILNINVLYRERNNQGTLIGDCNHEI